MLERKLKAVGMNIDVYILHQIDIKSWATLICEYQSQCEQQLVKKIITKATLKLRGKDLVKKNIFRDGLWFYVRFALKEDTLKSILLQKKSIN